MINFLRNWIEGIIIAVIIVSILEMILPNGNIKKYIKIVFGIYVILSIITPFFNNKKIENLDINKYLENITEFSDTNKSSNEQYNNNLGKIYLEELKKEIKQKINEYGYIAKTCEIKGEFDNNKENFGINKIIILLDSKNTNDEKNSNSNFKENISDIQEIEEINIQVGERTNETNNNVTEITEKEKNMLKKELSKYYELDQDVIEINT